MKKVLCFVLCVPALFLGGCTGIYENFREIERLTVVDTMGIDRIPGGVSLCFAASSRSDEDGAPVFSGSGDSIETAIDNIRRRSGDRELFCHQTQYIIIGESSAKAGIGDYLAFVGRSPLIRIDTPLYIVRGDGAKTLIEECGGAPAGISEVMAGIVQSGEQRGDCAVTTAAEVMRNILSRGSALVSALELTVPSDAADGKTAVAGGYAIIKGGKLSGFLSREQAIGVGFLTGDSGVCSVTVDDGRGGKAALDITGGGTRVAPVWGEDGSIVRVNISASVKATVSEISAGADLDNAAYVQQLTGRLEGSVSEMINSVLRLSASLGADFLGLGERVERFDPERYRLLDRPFGELLPALEVQLSVSGTINHPNDLDGGVLQGNGRDA